MRKWSLAAALLLAAAPFAAWSAGPAWPTIDRQLADGGVRKGSALERLIRQNQDFSVLRADEATDHRGQPLWLRVYWRKAHPEVGYSKADPTGGYPHVLKEIHEWLLSHQDLRPGPREADVSPAEWRATVGANLRTSGAAANPRSESDIRINFNSPTQIIGASNNIVASGLQVQFYSSDGGGTWGQTTLPLASTDSFHSDPAVDWTSDGRAWAMTLGIKGNTLKARSYVSTNGGATWTFDGTPSGSQRSVDKELMWVDHSASSTFKDNIYACWHNGNPAYVGRRTAAGWQTPLLVSGAETSGTAIGCDIKTNSAGNVFAFWPTTGNRRVIVAKSTTGGVSFAAPVVVRTMFDSYDIGVPAFNVRRALIYTSGGAYKTATKDNVYVTWTDLTGATGCTTAANEPGSNVASTCKTRIWFSRSTDGGATWSTAVMLNNQASLNDQFNQALAVDETTGKIGVMYYDTVADAGRKKTDVWYQSSSDDGVTWSAALKVTTAQTDETIAGANSGNQYGDYNSLSGTLGKFFPVWTDRRSGAKEEIWTAPIIDP